MTRVWSNIREEQRKAGYCFGGWDSRRTIEKDVLVITYIPDDGIWSSDWDSLRSGTTIMV
jgi:hypothetical protein